MNDIKIAFMAGEYDSTEFIDTDFLSQKSPSAASAAGQGRAPSLAEMPFGQLCKIGLAMTWPLLAVAVAALGIFIAILLRK